MCWMTISICICAGESIKENRIVYKPTKDGMITSLECCGEQGEFLAQFFGKRKPGIPELPEWRDALEAIKGT